VLDPSAFAARVGGEEGRWLAANVPDFDCPDPSFRAIYDFRWKVFKEHIRPTADGFVVTEFLPDVPWAGKHNTISCAAGHHFREGRWIRDPKVLDDYSAFWFRKGGEPRRYSFWAADSIHARYLVSGDPSLPIALLPDLVANYEAWEKDHRDPSGLFWQIDDRDGMEHSIGGSGYRPSINAYMYGDAMAIAAIAELASKHELAESYRRKAEAIRLAVEERLWDDGAQFYKTVPRGERTAPVDVREEIGFIPWYFGLPRPGREAAWAQLTDPNGFAASFGPTTAERRHLRFNERHKHECLWNGPSWPYATTQTLVALANVLNQEGLTSPLDKKDYFALLMSYARAQHLTRPNSTVVPWIDENLDPDSGRWIARDILHAEDRSDRDRGRDYNHSGFCDLVITGLVGLRPRADRTVEVNPLVPEGAWDYFCLDGIPYHGRQLTVLYDRDGRRYGRGAGLRVLVDAVEIAAAGRLARVTGILPAVEAPAVPAVADASQEQKTAAAEAEGAAGWRKFANNPVLGGDLGTCFDVSLLREEKTYRMWFSWRPKKAVALVEGTDGVHWGPPVIVLAPNPQTDWEEDINRPVVVKRPDGYHMWYTGQARGHSWIGNATSPDGKTWTRTGKRPVLAPEASWEKAAVMCPHVLWDEETKRYQMWYSGGEQYEPDAIGYATSADGLSWTKVANNPIFRADSDQAWERHKVTACQVVRDGGWYVMFYIGFRDVDHAQIGVARSRDGISGWERHSANPILRPGAGKWDADAVYKPFAIRGDGRWRLWYNGRRGSVEQIGMAIHEGDNLGFPER
jgi:hypothetical protein